MRIIDLAYKDLLQIFRDWRAAIFLIIMPIGFTVLFGFAFGGFGGVEEEDPRLPVVYHSFDRGATSEQFISLLSDSQIIRIEQSDEEDEAKLRESVADNDFAGALIIPAGYGDGMESGNPVPITFITAPASTFGPTVQGEVQTTATRFLSAVRTAKYSSQFYEERLGFNDPAKQQIYFEEALASAVDGWKDPPVRIAVSSTGSGDGETEEEPENSFAHSSTGMMAQFAIAGLMGAATILVLEKKNRVLQRLVTTPISRIEILIGHYLAMFVMIIVQLVILILFGQLLLDLNYLSSPLATAMLVIATALFAASLGLLIGAVANTEEQVIFLSLIPMFLLAGLGGAWVPLEITPEAFQSVARFTPLSWVVEGLKDIIVRGQGVEAIVPAVLVLLAYTAVLLALAVWRFRIDV
jgi:ABC-2 type transport system permease protein